MIKRTLAQIADMANAELSSPTWNEVVMEGASIDTRTLEKRQLFIPLVGENVDGHRFVNQAYQKGAAASFWQRDVPNPPEDIPLLFVDDVLQAMQDLAKRYREQIGVKIIGITGSNGKTSTKDIVAQVVSGQFKVQKTLGNYNSQQGLPLSLFTLKEDTEVMVLEMGMSDVGQIEILSSIAAPDIAIITNIGESHMETLGSRERIAEAKFEITTGLKKDGLFIYDGDEPLLQDKVKDPNISFTCKSFGKTKTSDIYPLAIELKGDGTEFMVNSYPDTSLFLPVLGIHNVKNAMAAILAAQHLGMEQKVIKKQLANLQLTAMRMETIQGQNQSLIINDAYNASPTSMRAAISLVHSLKGYEKKILILGDMLELGVAEAELHQEIGHFIAEQEIDYVFTYGTLGREIAKGMKASKSNIEVQSYDSKTDIIEVVRPLLDRQTVVLLKASRGMKLEDLLEDLSQ
ncbi:UDP-N-acetylmuramoyl-tripeptide--D-alanyl-D-alanine ligase [Gracilibacillus alcaliphilus]|uniref:UDP-N-acetylmuramoyl-tripeptide--D-alanyl-D- alanine ligase n=1 Tax=Gracilibacillus alcaliphilus TaxID=1401441 RepID=UPI00195D19C7|nr:UDP-N-acetylmuramoyl-tripeptide--D-alanyl-D-alanine ligase [Gracilibacillus alcaliphilus]MBM7678205.1 UDP-N-acetylmuramoyl-tripeptide--D-alanyl-D-alanine ligase [Gracilibacillus alcaliphilus]